MPTSAKQLTYFTLYVVYPDITISSKAIIMSVSEKENECSVTWQSKYLTNSYKIAPDHLKYFQMTTAKNPKTVVTHYSSKTKADIIIRSVTVSLQCASYSLLLFV